MDKNNFSQLSSAVNKISSNVDSIKQYLHNFGKKYNDMDLKNIDNELIEIKKILDSNNIFIKNFDDNTTDTLMNSINNKFNNLKNSVDKK